MAYFGRTLQTVGAFIIFGWTIKFSSHQKVIWHHACVLIMFYMHFLQPKTPITPKEQTGGSKTLFVGNLSYSVEQADVLSIDAVNCFLGDRCFFYADMSL